MIIIQALDLTIAAIVGAVCAWVWARTDVRRARLTIDRVCSERDDAGDASDYWMGQSHIAQQQREQALTLRDRWQDRALAAESRATASEAELAKTHIAQPRSAGKFVKRGN